MLASFEKQGAVPKNKDPKTDPSVKFWIIAKRMTLLLLLAAAATGYYLLTKMHEALSLLTW